MQYKITIFKQTYKQNYILYWNTNKQEKHIQIYNFYIFFWNCMFVNITFCMFVCMYGFIFMNLFTKIWMSLWVNKYKGFCIFVDVYVCVYEYASYVNTTV